MYLLKKKITRIDPRDSIRLRVGGSAATPALSAPLLVLRGLGQSGSFSLQEHRYPCNSYIWWRITSNADSDLLKMTKLPNIKYPKVTPKNKIITYFIFLSSFSYAAKWILLSFISTSTPHLQSYNHPHNHCWPLLQHWITEFIHYYQSWMRVTATVLI